jgi:hypothetical protein
MEEPPPPLPKFLEPRRETLASDVPIDAWNSLRQVRAPPAGLKPLNNHSVMVVLEHLDKQGKAKTLVFGNTAMGTQSTNVAMSMLLATQRPTVTLKLKPSPTATGSWPVSVEFDADYLQSIRINSYPLNSANPNPAWERFLTARKSAVSFGGKSSDPKQNAPLSSFANNALVELDMVMLPVTNRRRKFGTYMHYQDKSAIPEPLQNIITMIEQSATKVRVYAVSNPSKPPLETPLLNNAEYLKELLRLRETMASHHGLSRNYWYIAHHPLFEKPQSSEGTSYSKILNQIANASPGAIVAALRAGEPIHESLLIPVHMPWLQYVDKDSKTKYINVLNPATLVNKCVFPNPSSFVHEWMLAKLWEIGNDLVMSSELFVSRQMNYQVVKSSLTNKAVYLVRPHSLSDISKASLGERPMEAIIELTNSGGIQPRRVQGLAYVVPGSAFTLKILTPNTFHSASTGQGKIWFKMDTPPGLSTLGSLSVIGRPPAGPVPMNEFDLNEVFLGRADSRRTSPDFAAEYTKSTTHTPAQQQRVHQEIRDAIAACDIYQREVVLAAMNGAQHGCLPIYGFGGCGKTSTSACAIHCLTELQQNVMVVSHSNIAVDRLVEEVHAYFERRQPGKGDRVVRLYNNPLEKLYTRIVQKQATLDVMIEPEEIRGTEKVLLSVRPLSMAYRIDKWAREHPDDVDARPYLSTRAHAIQTDTPAAYRDMAPHEDNIIKSVVGDSCVYASTMEQALRFQTHGINKVDIVWVDEASTINALDLLPLVHRFQPRLIVLTGDPNQLPPTVMSLGTGVNPYDNLLQMSALEQLPMINGTKIYRLLNNYRQVNELFTLSNTLYYQGQMLRGPGYQAREHTDFSRSVKAALTSSTVLNGYLKSVGGLGHRLVILDVPYNDSTTNTGSSLNPGTLAVSLELMANLCQAGVHRRGSLGFMSFYSAEVDAFRTAFGPSRLDQLNIKTSVDSSQGQQSDLTTISFTRAASREQPFGFMDNARRLCVALSRARQFQVVVCNFSSWQEWSRRSHGQKQASKEMNKVIEYLLKLGGGRVVKLQRMYVDALIAKHKGSK